MKIIYENKVTALGSCVEEFKEGGMFILFGDSAPDEIKDYCYSVAVNPINGEIKKGQILKINDVSYPITCVGTEAPKTLAGLGHCTINMNGATEAQLPGTIHVGPADMPEIGVGTTIQIVEL